jgi:hypothetical protein
LSNRRNRNRNRKKKPAQGAAPDGQQPRQQAKAPGQGGARPPQGKSQPGKPQGQRHDGGRRDGGRRGGPGPTQQNKPKDLGRPPPRTPPKKIKYGVVFYTSFDEAKKSIEEIAAQAKTVDQLNIVVQAEGNMDDPVLIEHGKVFAGAAWTLIHKRRVDDGWYNELQE